ncbi:hypothetical protein ACJJTC_016738 [Scirpophaga incertulas]
MLASGTYRHISGYTTRAPMSSEKKLSMAAGAIALRGVRLFISAGRSAAERRAQAETRRERTGAAHSARPPQKTFEALLKLTRFSKNELESLFLMYKRLVLAAQSILPTSAIGQNPSKLDGIDQGTFRDVMHNTFEMITEEAILERIWVTWDRGAGGGEGALRFEAWARGLSVLLKGTEVERMNHCFAVYDLNADGYITRDEMFTLLKNSLLKQPGDEDPDEGVRELVELVLKKLDVDKDGRVSPEDYKQAVQQEPLLLEAFGQCLPSRRHATAFLKTLGPKT